MDVAFYHKKSKAMLVADVVLKVSEDPVPVATIEPEPLLMRGMEAPDAMLPSTGKRGAWAGARRLLFGLLFNQQR